jgi:hypothetical protein
VVEDHAQMDGLMELIAVHHNLVVDRELPKPVVDIRVEEVPQDQPPTQHQVVVVVMTVPARIAVMAVVSPDQMRMMADGDVPVKTEPPKDLAPTPELVLPQQRHQHLVAVGPTTVQVKAVELVLVSLDLMPTMVDGDVTVMMEL